MKLEQFDRVGRGTQTRYIANVQDITGSEDYELIIAGSKALIKKALRDSEFDIRINPKPTEDDWAIMQKPILEEQQASMLSLASLEDLNSFFKHPPSAPKRSNSIFISLRRIRGEGSAYFITLPFLLGTGWNLYVWLPPVSACFGIVQPLSGDADLFLTINSFTGPVRSSTRGGTATDVVTFSAGGSPFVPIFRVNGFTTTSGVVTWGGNTLI